MVTNDTSKRSCWFCNGRRPFEQPALVGRPAELHGTAALGAIVRESIAVGATKRGAWADCAGGAEILGRAAASPR